MQTPALLFIDMMAQRVSNLSESQPANLHKGNKNSYFVALSLNGTCDKNTAD